MAVLAAGGCFLSEEAQGDEDLLPMLSALGGERKRCPFDMQSSCYFAVLEVVAQRGDVVSFFRLLVIWGR